MQMRHVAHTNESYQKEITRSIVGKFDGLAQMREKFAADRILQR